jgi:hypothetical protein
VRTLIVGYPEERPTVELEGVFGDFKEGIVSAFVDYGNEYAANRHKGLVDVVNFFVISTPRASLPHARSLDEAKLTARCVDANVCARRL